MPITVAIVEDDSRVREALRDILESQAQFRCVGDYASAEEASKQLPLHPPRVALVDINLPDGDGVSLVHRLAPLLPDTQFLMLTALADSQTIFRALAAGAHGYLLKPVRAKQLIEAVRDVCEGGSPITSSIARKIVQSFQKPSSNPGSDHEVSLASREREVLDLLTQGMSYKEIADKLALSRYTIMTLVQRIYQKLHVHSRGEAVAKFLGL